VTCVLKARLNGVVAKAKGARPACRRRAEVRVLNGLWKVEGEEERRVGDESFELA
jgi:hypothetical protein